MLKRIARNIIRILTNLKSTVFKLDVSGDSFIIGEFKKKHVLISQHYIQYISQNLHEDDFKNIQNVVLEINADMQDVQQKYSMYQYSQQAIFSVNKRIIDSVLEEIYLSEGPADVLAFLCLSYQYFIVQRMESELFPNTSSKISPFVYAMQ